MIRHRPLLLTALGFMGGVLLAQASGLSPIFSFVILAAALVCLIAAPRLLTLGVVLLGASLGALRLTAFYGDPSLDVSRAIGPAPITVMGQVVGEPGLTRSGLRLILAPTAVDGPLGRKRVTGGLSVFAGRNAFDPQSLPGPGDLLRLTGILSAPLPSTNPGGFDWSAYLARRAVRCEMRVIRPGGLRVLTQTQENAPLRGLDALTASLGAIVQAGLPDERGDLVRGVLLGQRRAMPAELIAAFSATGTVHVLATAGLHVGILAWWLERLCVRLRVSRRAAPLVVVAVLLAYLALTGGRPAVFRAVLTACLYYGAILFERAPDLPTSLAAAALLILTIQPTALFEADFQLSFMTVLGLALAMPLWDEAGKQILEKIAQRTARRAARAGIDLVGLSLIAPLAAAPLTAYYFNQWSLVSLPANVIVVPLVALLIPLGIFSLLLGLMAPAIGHGVLAVLVGPIAQAILGVVTFFAGLPDASVSIASPSIASVVLWYGLCFGLLTWLRVRQMQRGPAWRNQMTP